MLRPRILLAGLLAALLYIPGYAQDPARLTLVVEPANPRPGETLTAWVDVALTGDWHIYSATTPPGGPFPTELLIRAGTAFTAVGPVIQPQPIREHDPNFDMEVEYFGEAVRFGARARVADERRRHQMRDEGVCPHMMARRWARRHILLAK